LYKLRIWIYLRKFSLTALGNLLDALGPLIVLMVGGYLVIQGKTQVGTLVVFISGLARIADPWDQLINFYRSVSGTAMMYDMIRQARKVEQLLEEGHDADQLVFEFGAQVMLPSHIYFAAPTSPILLSI
jgi:ABC-type bacteriocin/lantibiotic exporter with double-glycine peptidase domain